MNVQPFIQDSLIYLTDTLQAGVPAFEAYQTYCDRLAGAKAAFEYLGYQNAYDVLHALESRGRERMNSFVLEEFAGLQAL